MAFSDEFITSKLNFVAKNLFLQQKSISLLKYFFCNKYKILLLEDAFSNVFINDKPNVVTKNIYFATKILFCR